MFYHFNQNNSGGSFDFDENRGITHHVVIEADKASYANADAEEIGIYFNGWAAGLDCDCCGDRWREVWESDGKEVPTIYGEPVQEAINSKYFYPWMEPGKEVCVHYKDGRKEWF